MTDPLHIELDLHVEDDEVSGRATRDGEVMTFSGWIGLLAALDTLIGVPSGVQP